VVLFRSPGIVNVVVAGARVADVVHGPVAPVRLYCTTLWVTVDPPGLVHVALSDVLVAEPMVSPVGAVGALAVAGVFAATVLVHSE
jgi:hypothetical protein